MNGMASASLLRILASYLRSAQAEDILRTIPQLMDLRRSPPEDRLSHHNHMANPLVNVELAAQLKERLRAAGVAVEQVSVDLADLQRWLEDFSEIATHYRSWGAVRMEKCLEHYLAFRHLSISAGDTYVDIAAARSPWAGSLRRRGIPAYRLDRSYARGIHGSDIGADASDTGLPAGFASVLSAQCAFECFDGETDSRFLVEADRLLDERGRCGVVPLYLDDVHFVATSPFFGRRRVKADAEGRLVWRDDQHLVPFARHYSPEAFMRRVYSRMPAGLSGKVLCFDNLPELTAHYTGQLLYCFFMLCCEKRPGHSHQERAGVDQLLPIGG